MKIGDRVRVISLSSKQYGLIGTVYKVDGYYIKINNLSRDIAGIEGRDTWCTVSDWLEPYKDGRIIKVI